MLNLRNFIVLSLTVLTVVLLTRLTESTTDAPVQVDAQLQENFDYYITGMSNTRFDAMSKPTYQLQASRVTHYPETDIAKMENPHFLYYRDAALPWQLTALAGTLSKDPARNEDHLELVDDVVIRRPMSDGKFLLVTTASLDVFPDAKEVNTESAVTLEAGGSRLESTGMRAFLNEEKIELQTAVRGFHE
jgi:lipopolysaccharide export system protein LptC